MKYEKLKQFRHIFERKDFTYISDENHIAEVSTILLTSISNPNGKEDFQIEVLGRYLEKLTSFLHWLQTKDNPYLEEGYKIISEEIRRTTNLLDESEIKRRRISRGYCKKFNEIFLYGLKKFELGVQLAFHPNLVGSTNIDKEQLVRYILDKVIGLGRKFLFNKLGKYAFANKITELNMQELVVMLRLLLMPGDNQIRKYNGWIDLGVSRAPVRILIASRFLGKNKVYFLYKINEHPKYQAQILVHPDTVAFAAA